MNHTGIGQVTVLRSRRMYDPSSFFIFNLKVEVKIKGNGGLKINKRRKTNGDNMDSVLFTKQQCNVLKLSHFTMHKCGMQKRVEIKNKSLDFRKHAIHWNGDSLLWNL